MLRITVKEDATSIALLLEGRLFGEWVNELRSVWANLHKGRKTVTVLVSELLGVDFAGLQLLEEIHAEGGEFVGSGLSARTLIEKITTRRPS